MGFYSRRILPHIINCACGTRPIARQRAKVAPMVEGVVLELGFGSGLNMAHLDASRITKLYALEPEEGMRRLSEKAAAAAPFPVEVRAEFAETLSLPKASIDTLFMTYTLCTIPDPVSALAACRPFLKPEGRLVFCEHGLAPDAKVAKAQASIDIPRIIADAGYRVDALDTMYLPKTPRFAGFNYWGSARAA
jgi:ubiquinone/menaquinone biosynthesis C-methylase UbiE